MNKKQSRSYNKQNKKIHTVYVSHLINGRENRSNDKKYNQITLENMHLSQSHHLKHNGKIKWDLSIWKFY